MLSIIYPVCCGIDVHKRFVVACIASTNKESVTTYKTRHFSTFTNGLRELSGWLNKNACHDVCMESTGKYWIPLYNILEETCHIVLTHPKYVRAIKGKKTDKKDAKWIADLFKHDLVRGSFIPPREIRQLRDLMRYRQKLIQMISSERTRMQNCLTVSNIQLANVVTDTFGKSAQAIITKLLDDPSNTTFDIEPLIFPSLKKKLPELQLAVDGIISSEQAEKMRIIRQHIQNLELCKSNLESLVLTLVQPYQKELEFILTIPGISSIFSAIIVISEIGVDMSVFPSSRHLCSWAGLTPQNNESAGKKKSVRISPAGRYLKPLLVQCANGVMRSKECPEFKDRYQNIRKRRGHKKTVIAISRMLLTIVYHLLSKSEPYCPTYVKESLQASREISVQQAIQLAVQHGYTVAASTG